MWRYAGSVCLKRSQNACTGQQTVWLLWDIWMSNFWRLASLTWVMPQPLCSYWLPDSFIMSATKKCAAAGAGALPTTSAKSRKMLYEISQLFSPSRALPPTHSNGTVLDAPGAAKVPNGEACLRARWHNHTDSVRHRLHPMWCRNCSDTKHLS